MSRFDSLIYWIKRILASKRMGASLNACFSLPKCRVVSGELLVRCPPGIGLGIVLYHGRDDELRRVSAWQLDFSQARPDQLTAYLNLNAPGLDLGKVKPPDWPPRPTPAEGSAQK